MWDMNGLEHLINLTDFEKEVDAWEKKKVWSTLQGQQFVEPKPNIPLQPLIMRAKYNSQRHYEIYQFNSDEDEEFVRDMFENDPQIIVNFIRKNGYKIFSERFEMKKAVIV
jgi:hypothetical protein